MALTAGAALISDKNFHPSFFQNNNLYKYYIIVLRKEKLLGIFFFLYRSFLFQKFKTKSSF